MNVLISERKAYLQNISRLMGSEFLLNEEDKILAFNEMMSDLEIKIDESTYPDSVFYFKKNNIWMELNIINGSLWCSNRLIWSVFEKNFQMKYKDIQAFIKDRLENHFKTIPVTPMSGNTILTKTLENHFKMIPVTPFSGSLRPKRIMKNHFKSHTV